MSQDYNQAHWFVSAIAGDPNTAIMDWRALSDYDKADKGHARRGTLNEWWPWLCEMNSAGYGIFSTIAAMDGVGRHLANVDYLRANYIDNDDLDALQQADRAAQSHPAPTFSVTSSVGKVHTYWATDFYRGNDRFQMVQRKLRQLFNSDKAVIDAARVMRVPGTFNHKYSHPQSAKYTGATPHLVTLQALPGWGARTSVEALEAALQTVNVIDAGVGTRHELGEPSLAAPSLDWLIYGLKLIDPNQLDRGEWIALTAAIKQCGWSLTDPDTLRGIWEDWCSNYSLNDAGENEKQWSSIRNTELGWSSLVRRVPSLLPTLTFGNIDRTGQLPQHGAPVAPVPTANHSGTPAPGALDTPPMPNPGPPSLDCNGEFLTHIEQQTYFKGCVFVVNLGEMFTPLGRLLGPTQFNAAYGGKQFLIDSVGKKSNEAWAAATRSTLWTVPKVDHTRFVPDKPFMEIMTDDLGRDGVNVYRPANVERIHGDPSPFLNHIAALLPSQSDQRTLLDFLAHNARFPGHKIPWAPVIQSAEGAGKGVLKAVMRHVMGKPYVYFPKASELAKSGSTFNAWLRNKLFILVDEVKVDERRELIEVLKPLISEEESEVQSKGVDQDLEDNFSNWCFFTNWKDAIPVNKNARRFAIMYSPLQTVDDLIARGMDQAYFDALYGWLKTGGAAIVADWLMNYPIERGAVPMRAPETTSTAQALDISRGPVERMIMEAVEDGLQGFKGGWIGSQAVVKRIKETGAARAVSTQTVHSIIEGLGYVNCGRAPRAYFAEGPDRSTVFHWAQRVDASGYGPAQGY